MKKLKLMLLQVKKLKKLLTNWKPNMQASKKRRRDLNRKSQNSRLRIRSSLKQNKRWKGIIRS